MTEGGWKVALYLDERAHPDQAKALGAIFSGPGDRESPNPHAQEGGQRQQRAAGAALLSLARLCRLGVHRRHSHLERDARG